MDITDWWAPEVDDDLDPGDQLGLVYYGGQGYTPNEVRDFIASLQNLIEAAEAAEQNPDPA